MKYQIYYLIHLVSLFLIVGVLFYAFAAPAIENRKRILALSGVFALTSLVGGFGLLAVTKAGFPGWVIVKVVCWLLLALIPTLVFRSKAKIPTFITVSGIAILVAVASVTFKPF